MLRDDCIKINDSFETGCLEKGLCFQKALFVNLLIPFHSEDQIPGAPCVRPLVIIHELLLFHCSGNEIEVLSIKECFYSKFCSRNEFLKDKGSILRARPQLITHP